MAEATDLLFKTEEAVAEFLAQSAARWKFVLPSAPHRIPANSAATDFAVADFGNLASVLEHHRPDQVINVQTGITLSALDKILAQSNQMLPVSGAPNSTLADLLNDGDGGPLEHKFGGPRDLILGCSAALSSGKLIKCGGKVVKNVSGYDLAKLFIGSRGWFALVTSVQLRLYARPEMVASLAFQFTDPALMMTAYRSLSGSGLPFAALELVDAQLLSKFAAEAAGAELKEWLARKGGYLMFAQIQGLPAVVNEVSFSAARRVENGDLLRLPPELDAGVWSVLSQADWGETTVEVNATGSQIEEILGLIKTWMSKPAWQARPSKGRLKLFLEHEQDVDQVLMELRSYSRNAKVSLPVLHATDEYNYRASRLPEESAAARQLVDNLKCQYDPQRILNPFVSL